MGAESRRPPLPAPTDISSAVDEPSVAAGGTPAETSDGDLATNLSRHTDRTHYSIPEDGSPVTITTQKKHRKDKDSKSQSQTSLLIEYYEGQAGAPTSRPSLRVRVTPSGSRSKKHGTRDHIQISENKGGKPTNVRRISIPTAAGADRESISSLSEASSGRPPVEVDIMHNESELSSDRFVAAPSDVSAMPESSLGLPTAAVVSRKPDSRKETVARDTLKEPERRNSRSASRERLVQRVKEKVQADHRFRIKDSKESKRREPRSRSVSKELLEEAKASKSRSKYRDDNRSELSVVSSTGSTASLNNPKFLQAVEDAIKTLIPELNAVKEEQNLHVSKTRSREEGRDSRASERSLSKSKGVPKVRVSDERGHESSRRRSSRRSSRESVSEKSRDTSVRDEPERERKRGVSKGELAAAGIAGVALGLGASALKHRSSRGSVEGKRRRSSKGESRSRTPSFSDQRESVEYDREETPTRRSRGVDVEQAHNRMSIPPMPMQSVLESDLTRDSIVSADTEKPSRTSRTPVPEVREVSRGVTDKALSPLASPHLTKGQSASHEHVDFADDRSTSTTQPHFGPAATVGLAGAAAAAAYALGHHSHDGPKTPNRDISPVQSDNSYFYERDDFAQHPRVRSIKSNQSNSSERRKTRKASPLSGTPSPQFARDRKREGISLESPYEILPEDDYQPETPNPEEFDEWLAKEHEQNERYREEIDRESRLSHTEGKRDTIYTDDSLDQSDPHNHGTVGANPEYVSTPLAVESAVASLQEPSSVSVHSSESSIRDRGQISQPGSVTLVQSGTGMPMYLDSKARWEQIRDHAMALTTRHSLDQIGFESPAQSPTRSIDEPIMQSSYVPQPGDMPEIGVVPDDDSDLLTNPSILNPSIISGRMGEGIEMPSYEPSPNIGRQGPLHVKEAALMGAGAGLGLLAANEVAKHRQPTVEEAPDEPSRSRDLAQESVENLQMQDVPPISKQLYDPTDTTTPAPNPIPAAEMENEFDEGDDDVFTTQKQHRPRGRSGAVQSPLYDAATGKGLDRIQSKDIVALMDHLTVRDAHRNARDTEILVTLVRSAAEMRSNFEEMKRQIEEHDRMILNSMEKSHEKTVQRVLNGPRPFPGSTGSQTPKGISTDAVDAPAKRRNFFKRALRGLSARNSNDLIKIEEMLMQLLGEVEGLKEAQSTVRHPLTQGTSLNSYEHLRAAPETVYEPEGRTATNSGSPGAQSAGYLSNSSSRHVNNGMHSGYDGLRTSDGYNRISTVLEGDEDLEDGAVFETARAVQPVFQSANVVGKNATVETPPEQTAQFGSSAEETPRTEKTKSRYKSGASSIFSAIPKISRWSKTTTSTVPESIHNSIFASGGSKKNADRPASLQSMSQDSMTGSNFDDYEYEYDINEDDRLRSEGSLVGDQKGLGHAPQSPLIPGEGEDYNDEFEDYEFDDPKYQAHRNSLNLQHPQPKHGPTHRHKSHLEREAMVYNVENPPTPEADHWGSAPALALNKPRYSGGRHQLQNEQRVSPVQSDDGEEDYQQHNQQQGYAGMYTMPPALMSSGMHIGSPLEPIEEVRNSLETDRHSVLRDDDVTPEPQRPTIVGGHLHPGKNRNGQRKPSGPRDMPRSPSGNAGRASGTPVSYDSQRTSSMDSETF